MGSRAPSPLYCVPQNEGGRVHKIPSHLLSPDQLWAAQCTELRGAPGSGSFLELELWSGALKVQRSLLHHETEGMEGRREQLCGASEVERTSLGRAEALEGQECRLEAGQ